MLNYDAITAAVTGHFRHLHDGVIEELISREWDTWIAEKASATQVIDTARSEVERMDSELIRLTDAVAQGGSIPVLVKALAGKQRDRDEAAARLEHAQGLAQATDPG
jgi:hypothetical protein